MIDPRKGFIYNTGDVLQNASRQFFNASLGVLGFSKNFYTGLALHHVNQPNESMITNGTSQQKMRITAHAGATISLVKGARGTKSTTLMPNIIFQYQQGFMEMNIGTYVKYGDLTFGAWFRNKDAFILSLGIQTKSFRVGYSYDITVSKLNNGTSYGSHEVSMGFNLSCGEKPTAFRSLSCPSF